MSTVRWLELELSGFGVFDQMRIVFPDGLGIYVAPNEAGKSTTVAGLAAVLFGLPTSSDPGSRGTSRYRSYSSNSRFSGRLLLLARDGRSVEVRREFQEHEVTVRCTDPGGERVLFSGKHNPAARRSGGGYEDLLMELVGVASAELFEQTFSIVQPLAGAAGGQGISSEVAQLLSGSGGGSHMTALAALLGQIEERTKRTGDLGVTSRNRRNDRELEELDSRIADLEATLTDAREAADGLRLVQEQLAQLVGELQRLREEREEVGRRLEGARAWLEAQARLAVATRELAKYEEKLAQVRQLEARIAALRVPDEEEQLQVRHNWAFTHTQGRAAAFVRSRREDAAEAMRQYRLYDGERREVEEISRRLSRYQSLATADEALLRELHAHVDTERRLVAEAERTREDLEEIELHAWRSHPDRGFDDVVEISEDELRDLRRRSRRPAIAGPLAAVTVLLAGAVAVWLMRPEGQLLLALPPAVALLVGLTLDRLVDRKIRDRRRAAGHRLGRHTEWLRRVSEAPPPLDPTPYRERALRAQELLSEFRERVEPYRAQYPRLREAVGEFERLRAALARHETALARYARDFWGAGSAEVDEYDPRPAGGPWARLAEFLEGLSSGHEDVKGIVVELGRLEREWDTLSEDAAAWDRRTEARSIRAAALAREEAALAAVLAGEGVASSGELRGRAKVLEIDALAQRNRLIEICDEHPELPPYDLASERRDEVAVARRRHEAEIARLEQELASGEAEERDLLRTRAEKQGQTPVNLAASEIELAELRERRRESGLEVDALALAHVTLSAAVSEYQDRYLERLSSLATRYFRAFTARPERRVEFREDFGVRVVGQQGVALAPDRLSQGAQDQLAVAARLAVADMISDEIRLPLVFDDPFQNCDSTRLARIRNTLVEIARERQVLLLSHDESYLQWGEPVEVERRTTPTAIA